MSLNDTQRIASVQASQCFLDAKVSEFQAACLRRDKKAIAEAEENCRSALMALLDAKRMHVVWVLRQMDSRP